MMPEGSSGVLADDLLSTNVRARRNGTIKRSKPDMEKRRRARINASLAELRALIPDSVRKHSRRFSKLEKADILEMAVQYMRLLHENTREKSHVSSSSYSLGYSECAQEVTQFLQTVPAPACSSSSRLKRSLLSHLSGCAPHKPPDSPSKSLAPKSLSDKQRRSDLDLASSSLVARCLLSEPPDPNNLVTSGGVSMTSCLSLSGRKSQATPPAAVSSTSDDVTCDNIDSANSATADNPNSLDSSEEGDNSSNMAAYENHDSASKNPEERPQSLILVQNDIASPLAPALVRRNILPQLELGASQFQPISTSPSIDSQCIRQSPINCAALSMSADVVNQMKDTRSEERNDTVEQVIKDYHQISPVIIIANSDVPEPCKDKANTNLNRVNNATMRNCVPINCADGKTVNSVEGYRHCEKSFKAEDHTYFRRGGFQTDPQRVSPNGINTPTTTTTITTTSTATCSVPSNSSHLCTSFPTVQTAVNQPAYLATKSSTGSKNIHRYTNESINVRFRSNSTIGSGLNSKRYNPNGSENDNNNGVDCNLNTNLDMTDQAEKTGKQTKTETSCLVSVSDKSDLRPVHSSLASRLTHTMEQSTTWSTTVQSSPKQDIFLSKLPNLGTQVPHGNDPSQDCISKETSSSVKAISSVLIPIFVQTSLGNGEIPSLQQAFLINPPGKLRNVASQGNSIGSTNTPRKLTPIAPKVNTLSHQSLEPTFLTAKVGPTDQNSETEFKLTQDGMQAPRSSTLSHVLNETQNASTVLITKPVVNGRSATKDHRDNNQSSSHSSDSKLQSLNPTRNVFKNSTSSNSEPLYNHGFCTPAYHSLHDENCVAEKQSNHPNSRVRPASTSSSSLYVECQENDVNIFPRSVPDNILTSKDAHHQLHMHQLSSSHIPTTSRRPTTQKNCDCNEIPGNAVANNVTNTESKPIQHIFLEKTTERKPVTKNMCREQPNLINTTSCCKNQIITAEPPGGHKDADVGDCTGKTVGSAPFSKNVFEHVKYPSRSFALDNAGSFHFKPNNYENTSTVEIQPLNSCYRNLDSYQLQELPPTFRLPSTSRKGICEQRSLPSTQKDFLPKTFPQNASVIRRYEDMHTTEDSRSNVKVICDDENDTSADYTSENLAGMQYEGDFAQKSISVFCQTTPLCYSDSLLSSRKRAFTIYGENAEHEHKGFMAEQGRDMTPHTRCDVSRRARECEHEDGLREDILTSALKCTGPVNRELLLARRRSASFPTQRHGLWSNIAVVDKDKKNSRIKHTVSHDRHYLLNTSSVDITSNQNNAFLSSNAWHDACKSQISEKSSLHFENQRLEDNDNEACLVSYRSSDCRRFDDHEHTTKDSECYYLTEDTMTSGCNIADAGATSSHPDLYRESEEQRVAADTLTIRDRDTTKTPSKFREPLFSGTFVLHNGFERRSINASTDIIDDKERRSHTKSFRKSSPAHFSTARDIEDREVFFLPSPHLANTDEDPRTVWSHPRHCCTHFQTSCHPNHFDHCICSVKLRPNQNQPQQQHQLQQQFQHEQQQRDHDSDGQQGHQHPEQQQQQQPPLNSRVSTVPRVPQTPGDVEISSSPQPLNLTTKHCTRLSDGLSNPSPGHHLQESTEDKSVPPCLSGPEAQTPVLNLSNHDGCHHTRDRTETHLYEDTETFRKSRFYCDDHHLTRDIWSPTLSTHEDVCPQQISATTMISSMTLEQSKILPRLHVHPSVNMSYAEGFQISQDTAEPDEEMVWRPWSCQIEKDY